MMRRASLGLACLLALTACGGSGDGPARSSSSALSGKVTVFAAASLTESFGELGRRFQAGHPGTEVVFNFGPSSGLATQITQGAPADVFASASAKNMDQVVAAGAATSPVTFAENRMQIAVPPDNPAKVTGLADLAKPGVKVALCAAEVPCGVVARQVFGRAGVSVTPVTNEPDVKATLSKVQLGEVDAGVVYVTDVKAAGGQVTGVPIPAAQNGTTEYPVATLTGSKNKALAAAFVSYLTSPAGQRVLTDAGFGAP
jgi:molybdate transport system substrate-binding protein